MKDLLKRLFKTKVKELYDEQKQLEKASDLLLNRIKDFKTAPKSLLIKEELQRLRTIEKNLAYHNGLRAGSSYGRFVETTELDEISQELDNLIDQIFDSNVL